MAHPLYLRPLALSEALAALAARPLVVLAGGTDHYPARVGRPLDDDILDITAIEGLRGIAEADDHWRFGATTTWTDVIEAELPPLFDGLKLAAREVGGMQIQNAGTIAGNLCNASPAADGVPALLSLDAEVELAAADGTVSVPLDRFVLGNRRIGRRPDQLVTAIRVPKPAHAARSHFLKLGARRYLVISIVMVAGVLEFEAGEVRAARIAVGACSEVARRLATLETALIGKPADSALGDMVTPEHLASLSPIDDVRGAGTYRRDAAETLTRRLLRQLGAMA
ncbi:MAG: FAD binding domain-containing protein [Alphaproteobacteria bacterium]